MKQPMDRLPKKRPVQRRLRLASDMDLLERYNDMKKENRSIWNEERLALFTRLEAELEEDCEEYLFQAMPGKKYFKLIKDHPPTEEQKKEAQEKGDEAGWNGDTFPQALVYSCIQILDKNLEEFNDFWEELSVGEQMLMLMTCMDVNQGTPLVSVGNG